MIRDSKVTPKVEKFITQESGKKSLKNNEFPREKRRQSTSQIHNVLFKRENSIKYSI